MCVCLYGCGELFLVTCRWQMYIDAEVQENLAGSFLFILKNRNKVSMDWTNMRRFSKIGKKIKVELYTKQIFLGNYFLQNRINVHWRFFLFPSLFLLFFLYECAKYSKSSVTAYTHNQVNICMFFQLLYLVPCEQKLPACHC